MTILKKRELMQPQLCLPSVETLGTCQSSVGSTSHNCMFYIWSLLSIEDSKLLLSALFLVSSHLNSCSVHSTDQLMMARALPTTRNSSYWWSKFVRNSIWIRLCNLSKNLEIRRRLQEVFRLKASLAATKGNTFLIFWGCLHETTTIWDQRIEHVSSDSNSSMPIASL